MIKNERFIVSLHQATKRITKEIVSKEYELIRILQDVIKYKVYRGYKYPSLYKYLVLSHGLSEDRAYDFSTVAAASLKFKKLEAALAEGRITVSKARRITKVLTQSNQEEWLSKAHLNTHRGLEKLVSGENPEISSGESARYISPTQVEVKITISVAEYEDFKRAQSLLCQKQKKQVSMKTTFNQSNKAFLEKEDPVIKAARQQAKAMTKELKKRNKILKSSGTCRENSKTVNKGFRESVPRMIFHQIQLRDKGQCQDILPNGQKCLESKWIDIHHIRPVSKGGDNSLQNLITLCKGHHQLEHSQ